MTDLDTKLARLAELKAKMDESKAYTAEFNALKGEVYTVMAEAQSDKTKAVSGIYGLIVRRTTPVVTDMEALADWFAANGYPASAYQKVELDLEHIDKIAKDTVADTGELLPGLEYRTTESLSIRSSVKEGPKP